MLRTILSAIALGALATILSCTSRLGGGGSDAGADAGKDSSMDSSPDSCPGTRVPDGCYRQCNGTHATPVGTTCPAGYVYYPAVCYSGWVAIDGSGPVPDTCGDDASADADGAIDSAADGAAATDGPADRAAGETSP